jgi:hypothetical protein
LAQVSTRAKPDFEEIVVGPYEAVEPVVVPRLAGWLGFAVLVEPRRMLRVVPVSDGGHVLILYEDHRQVGCTR